MVMVMIRNGNANGNGYEYGHVHVHVNCHGDSNLMELGIWLIQVVLVKYFNQISLDVIK